MAGHFSEHFEQAKPRPLPHEPSNIDFFEAIAARYSLFFQDFEASMRAEGEWLEQVVGKSSLKILDACCGTGRQAIPLAQRGHGMTATDPCKAMLGEAKKLAGRNGVAVEFRQAGFLDLGSLYPRQFELVVAMGNGLCHLAGPHEIRSALVSLRACLKPGGGCLIGIKDFEGILRNRHRLHQRRWFDLNGERFVLFDVWRLHDPFLLSTSIAASTRDPKKRETLGATFEYMLRGEELERIAGEAGFCRAERLDHRQELVYRLSG